MAPLTATAAPPPSATPGRGEAPARQALGCGFTARLSAGAAVPVLILLCILGTPLLAHAASLQPLSQDHQQKLLCWLWNSASTLYADYSQEEKLPDLQQPCPSTRPPLPGCVKPRVGSVEPSSFLPFVQYIRPTVLESLPHNHDVDEIIDVLGRLQVGEAQEKSVNTSMSPMDKKWLVLSVLKQLVMCVRSTAERRGTCGHIPVVWEDDSQLRAVSQEPHPGKKLQTQLSKTSKASKAFRRRRQPRPLRPPG